MAKFTRTVVATNVVTKQKFELTVNAASEKKCLEKANKVYTLFSLMDDVTVRYKRNSFVKEEVQV